MLLGSFCCPKMCLNDKSIMDSVSKDIIGILKFSSRRRVIEKRTGRTRNTGGIIVFSYLAIINYHHMFLLLQHSNNTRQHDILHIVFGIPAAGWSLHILYNKNKLECVSRFMRILHLA